MCIGRRHTRRWVRVLDHRRRRPYLWQNSRLLDSSGATYATANESTRKGVEPVESQGGGAIGGKRDRLGELQEHVERPNAKLPLKENIKVGREAHCVEDPLHTAKSFCRQG